MAVWLFIVVGLVLFSIYLSCRRSSPNIGPRAGQARRPIEDVLKTPLRDIRYKTKHVSGMEFKGKRSHILSHIIHSVIGQSVILPFIHRKSRTDILGGEYIPEEPTFTPSSAVSAPSLRSGIDKENKEVLDTLARQYSSGSNCRLTSMDFYNAYKSGSCDPLDVAHSVLKAIAQSNSAQDGSVPLQAIIQVYEEDVLSMARASSERWANGEPLSYLDGVPVSIKGMYKFPPYTDCTVGTPFKSKPIECVGVDVADSRGIVSQLKKAGAIIIGMANLNDLCSGITGSNITFKPARNPYNTGYFCGGSSSGSGCSVSAGLCPISIGSDAGGSIRIPAAHCGVVGLKPTFKLLDKSGSAMLTYTVSSLGPLTASVLDTTIVMDILCGSSTIDLTSYSNSSLDGVKVGVFWEFFEGADKEIVRVCKEVVEHMRVSMGAECVEIGIPELAETSVAHLLSTTSEFISSLSVDMDQHFADMSKETLQVLALGRNVSAKDYINAQKQRTRAIRILQHIFKDVDVIVTPTVACFPPRITPEAEETGLISRKVTTESLRFVQLANLTGIPGIAVPVGMSSDGLPVSIQIMGPWYEEGRVLHVASKVEEAFADHVERPKVYYDVLGLATA